MRPLPFSSPIRLNLIVRVPAKSGTRSGPKLPAALPATIEFDIVRLAL